MNWEFGLDWIDCAFIGGWIVSVSLTLCKIPRHYQFRRPTSKTLTYLTYHYCWLHCIHLFLIPSMRWFGPDGGGGAPWILGGGLVVRRLFISVYGVQRGRQWLSICFFSSSRGCWSDLPWGYSTIAVYSVEFPVCNNMPSLVIYEKSFRIHLLMF